MQDVMRSSKKSRNSDGSSKESVRSTEKKQMRRRSLDEEQTAGKSHIVHNIKDPTRGDPEPPGPPLFGTHTRRARAWGVERRAWSGSNLLSWIPNGGVQGARTEMILRSTYLRAGRCATCRDR